MSELEPSRRKPYYFHCPKCNQNEEFYAVDTEDETGRNLGLLLIGGLLPYLALSRPGGPKYLCEHCGHIFPKPEQPKAFVTHMIFLGWFAFAVILIGCMIIYSIPEFWRPAYVVVHWIFNVFARLFDGYPEATVMILLSIPIASKLVCMYYNRKHRKVALADYRTHPPNYRARN